MKKTLIVLIMVLLAAMLIVSCNNNANSPVMHKVTFDSANGSDAVVKEVKDGDTVSEPAAPTKTGYTFAGWYEGETKFEFSTKITKDYSLKAKWEIQTFTVSFDVNGGTGSYNNQTINYGGKIDISKVSDPTRTGYAFLGWYDGENKVEIASLNVTKNFELKAKWLLLPVVGDTVEYGKYPENYAVSTLQKEPITWKVLNVDAANLRMLVISENVLEKQIWNSTVISSYEQASVRTYLNDDIYNNYSLSSYTNILNVDFDDDTITIGSGSDHLFLLSESEVSTCFGTNSKVAYYNGAAASWWLRTCTFNSMIWSYQTQIINERGIISEHNPTDSALGLRPAMWVSLTN